MGTQPSSMCLSSPLHSTTLNGHSATDIEDALAAFLDVEERDEADKAVIASDASVYIPQELGSWPRDHSISQFLCNPIDTSLGLVRFRLTGDHSSSLLHICFDYGQPPHLANALITIRHSDGKLSTRYVMQSGHDGSIVAEVEGQPKRKFFARKEDRYRIVSQGGNGEVTIGGESRDERGKKPPRSIQATMRHTELQDLEYTNKAPTYDKKQCAYILHFDGRVREASIKNFILSQPENVVQPYQEAQPKYRYSMRFGKISKKTTQNASQFALDVAYPLSPLQGIGIAMANILSKR